MVRMICWSTIRVHGEYVPELMAQNRRVVLKIFPL